MQMNNETTDMLWRGFLAIMIAITVMYLPWDAMAQFQNAGSAGDGTGKESALDTAFCNVMNWFNGPVGKGIATIAIIVVGIGALMGKVSWGMAIIVGIGVALIFGATTIVGALGGIGDEDCFEGELSGNKL